MPAVNLTPEEIDRRVAERTADLTREIAELKRSNADLDQFAYLAAHDLQEPLRAVTGYAQVLARRCQGKLDPAAEELLGFLVDDIRRMQTLVRDLLAYARAKQRTDPRAPVVLEEALRRALELLAGTIRDAAAEVTADPLPEVTGDLAQLASVLQNLIGNGIKFRGAEAPHIRIAAERRGEEWVVAVRDNGVGIDPRHHDRLFLPFSRLHTREERPGSGLGLALCKRILEGHGGRIWVESEAGRGATFFFALPAGGSAKS